MLVASLPFFQFRVFFKIFSLTHVMMGVVCFLGFIKLANKKTFKIELVDILIICYLTIAASSLAYSDTPIVSLIILTKSFIYFFCYFFLKNLFNSFSPQNKSKILFKGSLVGIIFSILFFVYYADFIDNFSGFNYTSIVKIYKSAVSQSVFVHSIESIENFCSKNIMRSVLTEIFVFYFLIFISFSPSFFNKFIFGTASFFLTILTFSRRGFFSLSLSLFFLLIYKNNRILKILIAFSLILVIVSVYYIYTSNNIAYRGFSLDITSRLDQYQNVFESITTNRHVILGHGYASQIEINQIDRYVHNFIFAGLHMLGIGGISIATLIFATIITLILKGFKSQEYFFRFCLLIPLFGMLVGSSSESIFTIPAWLCLAVYDTKTKKSFF
jgi:hypothetical protein